MQRDEVRNRIGEIGIIPCARVKAPDQARFAAESLYAAGHTDRRGASHLARGAGGDRGSG